MFSDDMDVSKIEMKISNTTLEVGGLPSVAVTKIS